MGGLDPLPSHRYDLLGVRTPTLAAHLTSLGVRTPAPYSHRTRLTHLWFGGNFSFVS